VLLKIHDIRYENVTMRVRSSKFDKKLLRPNPIQKNWLFCQYNEIGFQKTFIYCTQKLIKHKKSIDRKPGLEIIFVAKQIPWFSQKVRKNCNNCELMLEKMVIMRQENKIALAQTEYHKTKLQLESASTRAETKDVK
jgi:hypothetical protein